MYKNTSQSAFKSYYMSHLRHQAKGMTERVLIELI